MPIMCYEKIIKKLFKTKNSQSTFESKKSTQSDKLPRKRVNIECKRCAESDESWSSLNTCVEYMDSDTCSCRSSRSMHSSVCRNCAQSCELRSFRRHFSEYISPQQFQLSRTTQTVVPSTTCNLPPPVHRPLKMDLLTDDSNVYTHQKRRRTWNHIKTSLTTTSSEKLEKNKDGHNYPYQLHRSFHSPPPNRNPFDLEPDIR